MMQYQINYILCLTKQRNVLVNVFDPISVNGNVHLVNQ